MSVLFTLGGVSGGGTHVFSNIYSTILWVLQTWPFAVFAKAANLGVVVSM